MTMVKIILAALGTASLLAATSVAGASVPAQPHAPRAEHTVAARTATAAAATGMVASAAGCDPEASSIRPSGPPGVTAGSFMAAIRARGYLVAGVDQNTYHFGFLNPLDGQIEGFDIDMVRAVAQAIFGSVTAADLRFKAITDAQRIPDILDGSVDIVAHTMTITCDRLRQVDFSSVYFDAAQRVLVPKDSPAGSLAGLKGQKVCATTGSDSLAVIAAEGAVPVAVPYWTDCLVQLQQGEVAAISTDDSILDGLAAQDPWTRLVGPRLTDEPYGLAISKQHPEFVAFVNAVLQRLRTDGQWAASYARWIGGPVPAPPPARYGS